MAAQCPGRHWDEQILFLSTAQTAATQAACQGPFVSVPAVQSSWKGLVLCGTALLARA